MNDKDKKKVELSLGRKPMKRSMILPFLAMMAAMGPSGPRRYDPTEEENEIERERDKREAIAKLDEPSKPHHNRKKLSRKQRKKFKKR